MAGLIFVTWWQKNSQKEEFSSLNTLCSVPLAPHLVMSCWLLMHGIKPESLWEENSQGCGYGRPILKWSMTEMFYCNTEP